MRQPFRELDRIVPKYTGLEQGRAMSISVSGIYRADCLALLERIESERITLTYLDPPWGFREPLRESKGDAGSLRDYLGFLSRVLQQIHRVLSSSGSIYFHSEPRLSGHIRLILDQVFGREYFQNEIIWPREVPRAVSNISISDHDTIFVYSKSDTYIRNPQYRSLKEAEIATWTHNRDQQGPYRLVALTQKADRPTLRFVWNGVSPAPGESWRFSKEKLDELEKEGKLFRRSEEEFPRLKQYLADSQIPVGSIWDDIASVRSTSTERLEYPAQRPLALAGRIVNIGSQANDIVLDPFCGTGTTLVAAQASGRKWLGSDFDPEAFSISVTRIKDIFHLQPDSDFAVGDQAFLEMNYQPIYQLYSPVVTGLDDLTRGETFFLGKPVSIEETRYYEFKEVKTSRVFESIKNQADEYVVAFLNSEGGRIYWGIRDSDRVVVGVTLTYKDRDELRRVVGEKLAGIQPSIDPTAYRTEIFPVLDDNRNPLPDTWVVGIIVPRVFSSDPYFTSGNELFVRTDGGIKKLSGPQMVDWMKRRQQASTL